MLPIDLHIAARRLRSTQSRTRQAASLPFLAWVIFCLATLEVNRQGALVDQVSATSLAANLSVDQGPGVQESPSQHCGRYVLPILALPARSVAHCCEPVP